MTWLLWGLASFTERVFKSHPHRSHFFVGRILSVPADPSAGSRTPAPCGTEQTEVHQGVVARPRLLPALPACMAHVHVPLAEGVGGSAQAEGQKTGGSEALRGESPGRELPGASWGLPGSRIT